MGIPRGSARLLIEEAKSRPFAGTLLQLGRSTVYCGQGELEKWARQQSFELSDSTQVTTSHDPRLAAQQCLSDESFFQQLGFDEVRSCDISDWEDADYLFDLTETVPTELCGAFDVVFEAGTLIQIFDQRTVLENIHHLLRPGGRVIHCAVPSNNHMDFGFVMACPTLFADYYACNGYRIDAHYLCEYFAYWHDGRLYSDRWRIYDYQAEKLDALNYGRYGGKQAAVFLVATKIEGATGGVSPQLGTYRQAWAQYDATEDDGFAAGERDAKPSRHSRLRALSRSAVGRPLAVGAKRMVESVRRRLLPRAMPRVRHRF